MTKGSGTATARPLPGEERSEWATKRELQTTDLNFQQLLFLSLSPCLGCPRSLSHPAGLRGDTFHPKSGPGGRNLGISLQRIEGELSRGNKAHEKEGLEQQQSLAGDLKISFLALGQPQPCSQPCGQIQNLNITELWLFQSAQPNSRQEKWHFFGW